MMNHENEIGNNPNKCPSCDVNFIVTDGEPVCGKCGIVSSEREEVNEYFIEFSKQMDQVKFVKNKPTLLSQHDMGLSTKVGTGNIDAKGKPIKHEMKVTMRRLDKWDRRSKFGPKENNLVTAFKLLDNYTKKLNLNDKIKEDAAYIYRKALGRDLIRGRGIEAMMTASLYAVCRQEGLTRVLNDMQSVSNVKRKYIARCYRLIFRELDLKMPVQDASSYIPKISHNLNIKEPTKRKAISINEYLKKTLYNVGKDPIGMAASIIYFTCQLEGDRPTQKEIAKEAGTTEVTIRNGYTGIKSALKNNYSMKELIDSGIVNNSNCHILKN